MSEPLIQLRDASGAGDRLSVAVDALSAHPAHDKVPRPAADDLRSLKDSLAENGQQDPIDVTPDGVILDGYTRWTLLRQLGAQTVHVRVQDIPEQEQVAWIMDRAVARRHLSMAQKRDLNDVLRSLVTEVREHPRTGEEMRMGMSRTQRATALGVEDRTIKRWDGSGTNVPDPLGPTHIQRGGGNPTPLPLRPATSGKAPKQPVSRSRSPRAGDGPTPRHSDFDKGPPWMRHFTRWVRKAMPEQRRFLLHIKEEVDRAIALIEGQEGTS